MKTFKELDLIEPVQRALADEKYETPTPIQSQTIPAALQKRDVLGCAQTGTGKTAALALPILNQLGQQNRKSIPNHPLALILAPTRELAIQIGESFATYGQHLKLRQALVYGGVNQGKQVRALNRGAHILVATPGRLLDLINQGHIKLNQLETFVLDEADRMLDMGFLPDLKRIIEKLPDQRQSLFFSATLPPKITELAQSLLRDPVNVNVTPKSRSVERIEQRIITIDRRGKFPLLQTILESSDVERALVFTKTKRTANMLALQLMRCRINATAIHGNKSQNARQRALEAFRDKQVQVLVATDVAARGIDIDGITHVINYDLPNEPEAYVHRIGRTGRAGAEGIALSFCTEDDRDELRAIERLIGKKIPYDKNHSRPPRPEPKTSNGQRNRRNASEKKTSSRKPGSSQSNRRRNSGFVVNGEDKSKRKRRKVWPPKSRAKQTNN